MRNPSSSSSNSKVTPCCAKVGMKRGPWTPEEDEVLSNYIKKEGEGRWRTLPKRAGLLRCGKSCRLRWMNYLRPCVKRGQIASDEEDLILRLHRLLGNRWSLIAGRIPGRTDNEIKNYWNTHLSKKLISQGIDPRTHKPLQLINPDQHHSAVNVNGASSSKTNQNRVNTITTNPSPKSPINTTTTTSSSPPVNVVSNNNDDDLGAIVHGGGAVLINSNDVSAGMGELRSNNHLLIGNNEEDADDVFSSFLNSLINEDPFAAALAGGGGGGQHHQLLQPLMQQAPLPPAADADASSAPPFGNWETAVLATFDPHHRHDIDRANVNQMQ